MRGSGFARLVLAEATGLWAVRSDSATVYYIDVDARALLRQSGAGSSPGLADGRWVQLISVQAATEREEGVVRVGDRHRYVYDFDISGPNYGWWVQRRVTVIEPVTPAELAALPASLGDEKR